VTFSWILLYKGGNGAKHDALNKVFSYTLSEPAQAMASGLGFISLPADVVAKAKVALATVQP
jgi:phosphate transport system substrate-binding protein